MPKLGLQRDVKYAILTSPTDESHNFIETVCKNAGYIVKVFSDKNSAIAWLEA